MNPLTPEKRSIASTCGLCHDQCVSACPVVESSQTLLAYPSRLAMLVWEHERGNLAPEDGIWQGLAHCIHCNACTAACVYVDQPVDITPLVRRARRLLVELGLASAQLRDLLQRIDTLGSPYGDVRAYLHGLREHLPGEQPNGTLVIADAGQCIFDPQSANAGLRLLERAGYTQRDLSEVGYTGWELWQYGCYSALERVAQALAAELERVQPTEVVTLSPASAFLLRHVFPMEFGLVLSMPVLTLAEAILARFSRLTFHAVEGPAVFLVPAYSEVFHLRSEAARQVLLRAGANVIQLTERQPFRPIAYPEGLHLDLRQQPGERIAERIARTVKTTTVDEVVCTTAFSARAMGNALPDMAVSDWAGFLLKCLI